MVVRKKIFYLMKRHIVCVRWCSESSTDKIARTIAGDNSLQLWEVFWGQFIVLDQVSCCLGVQIGAQHSDYLLLELRQVINQ